MQDKTENKLLEWVDVGKPLSKLYIKITKNQKIAFISAFIGGLAIHMYPFTNLVWNYDTHLGSQSASQNVGWLLLQGKWFIESLFVLEGMGSDYIIPFKVIVALFFLAMAAALLSSALQIKSAFFCVLAGLLMAAFPAVTCIFMYDVKVYLWVVFFAALSVYFQYKAKTIWGRIASVITMIFTLGAYPPYFTIIAGGYLLLLIEETLQDTSTTVKILKNAFALLGQLILGLLGYYIVLEVMLKIKGGTLSNYSNIDRMTQIDFKNFPLYIQKAYAYIFDFFTKASGVTQVCYFLIITMFVISLLYLIINKKMYLQLDRLALLLLFVVLYPLALNITMVIDKGLGVHWLMIYGFVLFPLATIMLVEQCYAAFDVEAATKTNTKSVTTCAAFLTLQRWFALFLLSVLIYRWAITCNECYLRAQISYEKDYAVITNIADDIYENELMNNDSTILFTYSVRDEWQGKVQNLNFEYLPQYEEYTGVSGDEFMFHYDGVLERYMAMILGIGFMPADEEQKTEILKTDAYANMPRYPYNGYIQEINGVLVVKITDDSSLVS